jgi:quercetin dioxygenase-like cupin family protein
VSHPKAWGSEDWIVNSDRYCGKILTLRQGWQCSLHHHPIKDETLYLMSGKVRFELDGRAIDMQPGDWVRVWPGSLHRFTGIEDSVIVEFSTHHDEADVVRLEPSRKVDDPADLVDLPRRARA